MLHYRISGLDTRSLIIFIDSGRGYTNRLELPLHYRIAERKKQQEESTYFISVAMKTCTDLHGMPQIF